MTTTMSDRKADYQRAYRARRKAEGRALPRGAVDVRMLVGFGRYVVDPLDYSHPDSDVRRGP